MFHCVDFLSSFLCIPVAVIDVLLWACTLLYEVCVQLYVLMSKNVETPNYSRCSASVDAAAVTLEQFWTQQIQQVMCTSLQFGLIIRKTCASKSTSWSGSAMWKWGSRWPTHSIHSSLRWIANLSPDWPISFSDHPNNIKGPTVPVELSMVSSQAKERTGRRRYPNRQETWLFWGIISWAGRSTSPFKRAVCSLYRILSRRTCCSVRHKSHFRFSHRLSRATLFWGGSSR